MPDQNGSTSRTQQRSRTRRRERALAATRRRLRLLEIETHRIKAELARLEAENEDDIADELTGEIRDEATTHASDGFEHVVRARRVSASEASAGKRAGEAIESPRFSAASPVSPHRPPGRGARTARRRAERPSATGPRIRIEVRGKRSPALPGRSRRRRTRPALWSLALHAVVLLVCLPWSFAVLTNDNIPLLASSLDLNVEPMDDASETAIELADHEEFELPDVAFDDGPLDLADSLTSDLMPFEESSAADLAASLGQLDALPTDLGVLTAGGGRAIGDGGGRGVSRRRGRLRGANFFGSEAIGDRIVFLVDNSGSMKQGRMETTIFQLLESVDAMTDEQSFYVVFYSDQAYPMFYPHGVDQPVAATRENKRKLLDWLRTVELCIGGKLVDAMDLAVGMRPDVVYILSDGDISSVRTMQRLTEPSDGSFAMHTLGMGVKKPDHAAKLAAIAAAHGGSFRMVQPTPAAVEMARRQPIRSNPSGVAWGMGR